MSETQGNRFRPQLSVHFLTRPLPLGVLGLGIGALLAVVNLRPDDWWFVVVALGALLAWRASVRWILRCQHARVTTSRDPALFHDQQEGTRHALYSSLKGPAAKGFDGHRTRDRRAHVLAMQTRRRG